MFSLSRRKILDEALAYRHCKWPRLKWWLRDEGMFDAASYAGSVAEVAIKGDKLGDVKIFKQTHRKAIFRFSNNDSDGRTYVAKVFLLNHLSHRLSYHLYGMDEAAKLIEAGRRGIKVPQVLGYGHIYDRIGLVRASIVILENMSELRPIGEVLSKSSATRQCEIFMSTIPLFVQLYRVGCNHIDINSGAIMLKEKDALPEFFLLDFQHARFYDKPDNEILMFEAGYFARSCRTYISTEIAYRWLEKLLTAVGIKDVSERYKKRERFEYYYYGKGLSPTQSTLSRKQRRNNNSK